MRARWGARRQSSHNCASVHFRVTFSLPLSRRLLKLPNFEEKSSSRERYLQRQVFYLFFFSRMFFQLVKNHKKRLFCQMCKNSWVNLEERETVRCLESKVPNYSSTKTRTEAKYQTFRGQNSYSSSFVRSFDSFVLESKAFNKVDSSVLQGKFCANKTRAKQRLLQKFANTNFATISHYKCMLDIIISP